MRSLLLFLSISFARKSNFFLDFFFLVFCFAHTADWESLCFFPPGSVLYLCPQWSAEPLSLMWENHTSRLASLQQSIHCQWLRCLWLYTVAFVHSWEISVKGPLERNITCDASHNPAVHWRSNVPILSPEGSCIIFSFTGGRTAPSG